MIVKQKLNQTKRRLEAFLSSISQEQWISFGGLLVTLFVVFLTANFSVMDSLSLEQELRCGQECHIHTDECFDTDVLRCGKKEHTHSKNCYLVLLAENNMYTVLKETDEVETKTLETVIETAVDTALVFNANLNRQERVVLNSDSIAKINKAIKSSKTEENIPDLVLNEHLNIDTQFVPVLTGTKGMESMTIEPTPLILPPSDDGVPESAETDANTPAAGNAAIMPLADTPQIPDKAKANSYKVNVYYRLDKDWKYIGNASTSKSGRTRYLDANDVTKLLNTYGNTATTYSGTSYFSAVITAADNSPAAKPTKATLNKQSQFTVSGSTYYSLYIYEPGDSTRPLQFFSVTYPASNSATSTDTTVYQSGETLAFADLPALDTGWTTDGTNRYTENDTLVIQDTTNLQKYTPTYYNVKFDYPGTEQDRTESVESGSVIDFSNPSLAGYRWSWTYNGNTSTYSAGDTLKVERNMTLRGTVIHRVTFVFPDSSQFTLTFNDNDTFTITGKYNGNDLEGYTWSTTTSTGSKTYRAGDRFTVTEDMTLIGRANSCTIAYTLNAPFQTVVGINKKDNPSGYAARVPEPAYIAANGGESYSLSTTETDVITIENVTREYTRCIVNEPYGQSITVRFLGWKVEGTDTILQPGASLNWETITQYMDPSEHKLRLIGQWDYHTSRSVGFYIRYDSVAVDINGDVTNRDSNLYTPELHNAYVFNVDTSKSHTTLTDISGIADTTADNSYTADYNIRQRAYPQEELAYLSSFPDDEDVFRQLQNYASHLSVDGEAVRVEELNSDGYAIRWYVFKCQTDSWHVDGKLVRKQGELEITKSFAGNKKAIQTIEGKTDNPYNISVKGDKSLKTGKTLTLNKSATQKTADGVTSWYDKDADVYHWLVSGMTYGEHLSIVENNYDLTEYKYQVYSEYSVEDALNRQETDGTLPFEKQISLIGMTYALDTGINEVMKVNLTNVYYGEDSIVLKKRDRDTGNALAGASFEVYQQKTGGISTQSLDDEPVEEETPQQMPNATPTTPTAPTTPQQQPAKTPVSQEKNEAQSPTQPEKAPSEPVTPGEEAERAETEDNVEDYVAPYTLSTASVERAAAQPAQLKATAAVVALDCAAVKLSAATDDAALKVASNVEDYDAPSNSTPSSTPTSPKVDEYEPVSPQKPALQIAPQAITPEEEAPGIAPQAVEDIPELTKLTFRYDASSGAYYYDPNGTTTVLTAEKGFYEVSIMGVDFADGPIVVDEIAAPDGYIPVQAVHLGNDGSGNIVVLQGSADYDQQKKVLSVDNSSESTNVHVTKVWQCEPYNQKEVTLQLLANGHRVTTLFPSLASIAEIKLNKDNQWSYDWENLPLYANGNPIEWAVQETRIGTDRIRDNGTFLNYVVSYTSRQSEDGDTHITVTNALRQASLFVTKTNLDGSFALAGATYQLEKLIEITDSSGSYEVDPSFVPQQATSDSSGLMQFKGIQYGRYLLTETQAPDGYYMSDPIELLLNEDGVITVFKGDASYNAVAYNVTVRDMEKFKLPATGADMRTSLLCSVSGLLAVVMLMLLTREWRWKAKKRS